MQIALLEIGVAKERLAALIGKLDGMDGLGQRRLLIADMRCAYNDLKQAMLEHQRALNERKMRA